MFSSQKPYEVYERTCLMYHAACKIEFQPFNQVVLRPMTMETRCSQTYDNGNAMFQSYLSTFKKKKPAEDTLVPVSYTHLTLPTIYSV